MNGADAIVKCLEMENTEFVFGYPGVAICPFYNSILNSNIKTVLVRHEQHAGHAASGYARLTGKVGVVAVTSGPGATNVITGIATAYADSIPLVVITGQVDSRLMGSDVFQEADISGACESFVKYSYIVRNAEDIPHIVKEAFYIASTGRKGPVLIDFPIDIQNQKVNKFEYPDNVSMASYKPTVKGNIKQIDKVVRELKKAKRPLICTGGGAHLSGAADVIRAFAEKHRIPVVSTMMGIGTIAKAHPLYFGMLGNNGKPYANKAVSNADLLMVVGARIADRAVPKPEKLERRLTVIHIDIDSAEIGKMLGPTLPLVGDIRHIFTQLMDADIHIDTSEWIQELEEIKVSTVDHRVFSDKLVNPMTLVQTLSEKMDDDAVYVADVGQNQLWSADNYVMKNGRFLTTGGMGTMGYSIPAALGAKMAEPGKQVVAVCGDGAFQMSMFELATIAVNKVPLKILVLRNEYLGLVREHQEKVYDSHYSGVQLYAYPHYDKLAQAYDMDYFHADSNETLGDELDRFLACGNAAIMVCDVDSANNTK